MNRCGAVGGAGAGPEEVEGGISGTAAAGPEEVEGATSKEAPERTKEVIFTVNHIEETEKRDEGEE